MSELSMLFEGKSANERRAAAAKVVELLDKGPEKGGIDWRKASLRDIAESTLGRETFARMMKRGDEGAFVGLRESADPVNTQAFNDITGNILMRGTYEAYNAPEYIGSQLVTEESDNQDVLRIPGLALIDDKEMDVKEGEEYPTVKFGQDYIDRPASKKRGMKIAITREMLFFDRTGDAIKMAQTVGERLATGKENRILRMVLGIDNNFVRTGTARNTYVASADPRINKLASTQLVDWSSLSAAYQLFAAMNDDRTDGEPIDVTPDTLFVMPQKLWDAQRILGATQIREATNSGNRVSYSPNPVSGKPFNLVTSMRAYKLLVSPSGSNLSPTNAQKYWYYGQFKKAFRYCTLFPLQMRAAGSQHDDDFDRDVVAQYRADERGIAYVWSPWHVAEIYDT